MLPISSLLPEELTEQLHLKPPYRGRQIFSWLHQRLVFDFDGMSDLPGILREQLKARTQLVSLRVEETQTDKDVKVVLRTRDDIFVEAVRLGDRSGRQTACLSTQAGCGMGCSFCRTAQMGLRRNLRADEIVDQFLIIQALGKPVSNVVFMGMGEPLCNLDDLQKAVRVMCYQGAFSLRRITLSTCGLVEGLRRFTAEGPAIRLAISLVTADPLLRARLMPAARANPLPRLREALLDYQRATGRRITLEMVLLKGVNDREQDLKLLLDFIRPAGGEKSLQVMVNLISFNPSAGLPYSEPTAARLDHFRQILKQKRIAVTLRRSRGRGVAGACGQLGSIAYGLRSLTASAGD